MSGAGLPPSLANILALTRPDLAAQQMQIGQQQQFGGGLLQQEPQYTPGGVVGFGGAANTFGSKLLGALMLRNANKQQLELANQYRAAMFPQQSGMEAQPASQPPSQPNATPLSSMPPNMAPQPNAAVGQRPMPPLGSLPPGGLQAPPAPVGAGPQAIQAQPQQVAQAQPQSTSIFDEAVPDIPAITGGDQRKKIALYASNPDAYMKAYYDSKGMTNEYKNALTAAGGDPQKAAGLLNAEAVAKGTTRLYANSAAIGPDGKMTYGPDESRNTYYTTGPNGEPIAHQIQSGAEIAAQQEGLIQHQKELNTILPDVPLSTGGHQPMFGAQAVGLSPPPNATPAPLNSSNSAQPPSLGVRSNNLLNMQPGGKEASYANPTAGMLAASSNLDNYAKQGINTTDGIVTKWVGANDPNLPSYKVAVAKAMNTDGNAPLNLNDPNVKGQLMEAMGKQEVGPQAFASATGQQPTIGSPSTAQAEVNKATGLAAVAAQKQQAITQGIISAIQGMRAINDQVPDGTLISPERKAEIDEKSGGRLASGDAGALAQWEQLNSQGILNGIAALSSGGGLGRMDIPIIKQIVAGHGISADTPKAERGRLLDTLETQFRNNLAFTQNTAANLNQPGAATNTPTAPMGAYTAGVKPPANAAPRIRHYNPQTGRLE